MNWNRIFITIANAEGCKLKPYYCTAGKLTIGYGRNLEAIGITDDEAEGMLRSDITTAHKYAEMLVDNWSLLSELRQEVLTEMVFQLGFKGTSRFKKMLEAIEANDFTTAGIEMLDSRWAKQTPGRARRLAENMTNG